MQDFTIAFGRWVGDLAFGVRTAFEERTEVVVLGLLDVLDSPVRVLLLVDDRACEPVLGLDGWVAGSGIAFPMENQYLWELTRAGKWTEALAIYRWFTPLLHLDVSTKFVQYIKLAVQEAGLGKEWMRAPRLPLTGAERERVLKIIHDGIANRPAIPGDWKPGTWS